MMLKLMAPLSFLIRAPSSLKAIFRISAAGSLSTSGYVNDPFTFNVYQTLQSRPYVGDIALTFLVRHQPATPGFNSSRRRQWIMKKRLPEIIFCKWFHGNDDACLGKIKAVWVVCLTDQPPTADVEQQTWWIELFKTAGWVLLG